MAVMSDIIWRHVCKIFRIGEINIMYAVANSMAEDVDGHSSNINLYVFFG